MPRTWTKRDIRLDVLEYLAEYPGMLPDREVLAKDLGYSTWGNLERVLYRKGCRDIVHTFLPGRRKREDVDGTAPPENIRRNRRNAVPPERRRLS